MLKNYKFYTWINMCKTFIHEIALFELKLICFWIVKEYQSYNIPTVFVLFVLVGKSSSIYISTNRSTFKTNLNLFRQHVKKPLQIDFTQMWGSWTEKEQPTLWLL